MKLSFVIITYRRPELLLRCLESLRPGEVPDAETCVVFNGEDEHMASLKETISARYPQVRLLRTERCSRGEARNRAIARTRGRVVYFLDDDTILPEGFAERVLEKFERHPGTPCIGGPNIGLREAAAFGRAVDFLLRSPLGAGPMRVRYLAAGNDRFLPGWCFMLCNLGVRREIFERQRIYFQARCTSAEENLFLHQVETRVGPALCSPDLYVTHERRSRIGPFCRQVFHSGRGRSEITRREPGTLQWVVLLPLLWLLYLLCLPFLTRTPWLLFPLALYGSLGLVELLRMAFLERDFAALWLPLLIPLAHLSYALGLIAGAVSRPKADPEFTGSAEPQEAFDLLAH